MTQENPFQFNFRILTSSQDYKMEETKAKYFIQFGICPYLRFMFLEDMKNMPFMFRFDETTTSQIKKQYGGYVNFYSKQERKVVTRYTGSLFVGHYKDGHICMIISSNLWRILKWTEPSWSVLAWMDPTSTSHSNENLWKSWRKTREIVFSLGSCGLHTVNNGFGKGLKQLKETLDVEQFLIDLYFFFFPSARRKDYKEMENLTDVTAEYLLTFCSTRWLYIRKVFVRMMEQKENIKEYFFISFYQHKKDSGKKMELL